MGIVDKLSHALEIAFPIGLSVDFLGKITRLIVILVLLTFVWLMLRRVIEKSLQQLQDSTTTAMIQRLIKLIFAVVCLLVLMQALGLEIGTFLASAGVFSLTLGFALKDTLSNVVSGFLIFIDRPFTINDLVEIDGQYGRVDRITLRTTRVVTSDGRMLAVPNSVVMNKTIASYTNFPHLRIDVPITIAVTENLDRVRAILLSLVQHDPVYLQKPAPRMVVTAINDYNIAIELQAWLHDEKQHIEQRFALREAVFKTLMLEKIEMPLETIQLAPHHVKVTPTSLDVFAAKGSQ